MKDAVEVGVVIELVLVDDVCEELVRGRTRVKRSSSGGSRVVLSGAAKLKWWESSGVEWS